MADIFRNFGVFCQNQMIDSLDFILVDCTWRIGFWGSNLRKNGNSGSIFAGFLDSLAPIVVFFCFGNLSVSIIWSPWAWGGPLSQRHSVWWGSSVIHSWLCLSFCLFLGFCRKLLLWNDILLEDGRKNRICFGLFLVFGFCPFLDFVDGIHLWRNELCCAQSKSAGHTKIGRKYLARYVFLNYPKVPRCPGWDQQRWLVEIQALR